MNTEIHIEGYRADLTAEISALLNFAIDDIKNFSARSTAWSRTIVLPGTANNNRLFGHIFQVGQGNGYNGAQPNIGYNYNAAKSANVILFQDQIQAFKGVLRLLDVIYYGGFQGRVEYEVSIFGNISGLNTKLTGALLEDLDFSTHDHTYSVTNIVGSWDNPGGSGYYYPLIDYGNASVNKHDWDIKTFRPAFYLREYVDKIFTDAGYRYQCALFDTTRFKSIVIPHNQKEVRINQSVVATGALSSDPGFAFLYFDGDDPDPDTILFNSVPFNNLNSSIFTATLNAAYPAWGYSKFTYTDTPTVTLKLKYTINGRHWGTDSGFQFTVNKNGDAVNGFIPSTVVNVPQTNGTTFVPFTIQGEVDVTFNTGDYFEMWFYHGATGTWDVRLDSTSLEIVSSTGANLLVPITLGQTVKCNDCIPKNIRQIDFLVGIVKIWNLYVYEDKNDPYLIFITPYIDYYSKNTSNAVDWTHKLNHNKAIKATPMSELNAKIYKFKFKSDSDYYNDLYRKRYNEGYGDRIYDSEFEFSSQTNEFELAFSATPLIGYNGEDKVYSTIFKRTGTDPSVTEESIDSNIRLLLSKKVLGVTSWDMKDGATVINTLTRYGYAGHLDDPDVPTNDLNFGAPKELFFVLTAGSISNNQFNVYWSTYMREVTDKDSKLVKGYFYLTAKDILSLDFSKYIYVDGIAYRLNEIKDYNFTKATDCLVELFKVNTSSYSEQDNTSGPPAGCYLLWSDEQTLDYDDGEELLYSDCNTNPGDGDPDPPDTYVVEWGFAKTQMSGSFSIFKNDVIIVNSTAFSDSGSFLAVAGDEIRASVGANLLRQKFLFISNDVDGVIFSDSSIGLAALTHTFTVEANKNYNIQGNVS